MSKFEQLLLFPDPRSETEIISDELVVLTDHVDSLRRGLFKRFSSLSSGLLSVESRLSILEQQIYMSVRHHQDIEDQLMNLTERINNLKDET